jgi:hemoglobin
MGKTLFEHAGGAEAFLTLARAHHARCLADPELNHPFSHPGGNPRHDRLGCDCPALGLGRPDLRVGDLTTSQRG